MEKKFTVRIFDGEYTSIYTTSAEDAQTAQDKIVVYHLAFGGKVKKVCVTEKKC